MKRKLLGFLCVCTLISGCGLSEANPLDTEPPRVETSEEPHISLLEQGIALEESSNLMYIPCEMIEGMTDPEMHLLGNGLLLSECREKEWAFYHISLEDGALLASGSLPAAPGTEVYIGSGEMGLCDRRSGVVSILDEGCQLQRTYRIANGGDEWYLNAGLDTLYIFFSDRGLMAYDLESGEESWLVENIFCGGGVSGGNGYVILTYTGRTDQKTYSRCLDLSKATLETLPVDGEVTRLGETWLIRERKAEGRYSLVDGGSSYIINWMDGPVRLLSPHRHLLAADASGRNLSLFECDGGFVSRCALPQNSSAVVGEEFIWSDYWEGYFFADFIDSSFRLMFWDVSADMDGEDLEMSLPEQIPQIPPVVEPQLYERAGEISQRFGVEICIAEQCSLDYSHYEAYALTEPAFIRSALDILEEGLSRYPEGFFHQLRYGTIESIRIELVGGLWTKDGVDSHPNSVSGFAQHGGNCYIIVLDGFLLKQKTLFHEISHVIDKRLDWDSFIRADALFSEEAWLALQPEGFDYAYRYTEIPKDLLRYMESGYFDREYALTFPTEDRATLMAAAMINNDLEFAPGSGRREKLQYYADCIRDCFDTTGWPEIAPWEQALQ